MTYTQFNIGVFGVGFLNVALFHGDLGMSIFTTMIQVCLLVVWWCTLARRRIAEAHGRYLHGIMVALLIGNEAKTIRKILDDSEMTPPGMAGIVARHIATERERYLSLE
ncbi:hypothetical protein [Pantoea septica]|uniref:hypothetical protein n=1 Tax=Pantoea septica TaxID=472695 RepID=UPI0023F63FDE|nr:hypothetical protein [Pantoea septica]